MRTSTARLKEQRSASKFQSSHTKISNLDALVLIEEKVLGLEVAVANVELVAVVDTRDNLTKVSERFGDIKTTFGDKMVEEFASFDVFEE